MGGGGTFGDIMRFGGDVFTGGAFSAREARKQAEKDAKKQEKEAAARLQTEKEEAATAVSTAGEAARKKREMRGRRRGSTTATSPVGIVAAAPGARKTLLGQ